MDLNEFDNLAKDLRKKMGLKDLEDAADRLQQKQCTFMAVKEHGQPYRPTTRMAVPEHGRPFRVEKVHTLMGVEEHGQPYRSEKGRTLMGVYEPLKSAFDLFYVYDNPDNKKNNPSMTTYMGVEEHGRPHMFTNMAVREHGQPYKLDDTTQKSKPSDRKGYF